MENGYSQLVAMPGAITAIDVQAALTPQATEDWFFENGLFGSKSDSGERVNPTTALGLACFWRGVNLLASDIGQLPWHKMRQRGKEKYKDRKHPLEYVLTQEPNPWLTPQQWRQWMVATSLLWGNAISLIQPTERGRVMLLPLMPDVTDYVEIGPGDIWITTRINNEAKAFPYSQCFHIRGFSISGNGFWGASAIEHCKNELGHGLALQKHGNRTFQNNANPSGVLQTDGDLSPEARKNLRNEWNETHRGVHNAGKIAVLVQGLKWAPMSMSNDDAQWLDSRRFNTRETSNILGLPPYKLGDMEDSSVRANLEEQQRDYMQSSLSHRLVAFNQEASRKLLTQRERDSGEHYFKFITEQFLQGTTQSRYESYQLAISSRILNPNECREKEDLNPYDGGDEYLNPSIDTASNGEQQDQAEHALAVQQQHARKLIQERVEKLLTAEANRVKRGCAAKDFVKWATSFYDGYGAFAEEFLQLVCDMAESVGVKASWWKAVESHAIDNLQMCLSHSELTSESPAILESQIINQHHKLTSNILG